MINYRCWCGHQSKSHAPFGETEYIVGVGKKKLTACKWCDKAIANLNKKKETDKYCRETKAEENAVDPHPLAEEKPQWVIDQERIEFNRWLELEILESKAKKLATSIVDGGDEPSEEQERTVQDAVHDVEKWIKGLKRENVIKEN